MRLQIKKPESQKLPLMEALLPEASSTSEYSVYRSFYILYMALLNSIKFNITTDPCFLIFHSDSVDYRNFVTIRSVEFKLLNEC